MNPDKKIYIQIMYPYSNINQGIYQVQSGYRHHTAIVECPYISHKIEVYGAHQLKILHGAQIFWTEIRRQYLSKRKGNRQVISAAIVGIKHCQYLCDGKQILCTLKVVSEGNGYKVHGLPVNKKLPSFQIVDSPSLSHLDFSNQSVLEKYEHGYFWAQVISWNYEDELPKGRIMGIFRGDYKSPEVEGEVLLHNMEISQKKSTLLNQKYLKGKEEYLPVKSHKELNCMVFTIDPQNSIDMQDGLSLQNLGNSMYEVGVHISDVTSYSHLVNRREIALKGTSIYLPHKTIHMMPPELIDILALKAKKRRLAFSVFFKISEKGEIIESRFEKTIVTSSAQLSYEEAQDILNNSVNEHKFMKEKELTQQELVSMREKLFVLRKIARNRRNARSSCEMFDKNEVIFQLDQKGLPLNIGLKKRIQSEKIVEQFMIMTNYEVAKKLVNDFGANSLIIYHPKPLDSNLQHLNGYLSDLGVKFKAVNMMHFQQEFKQLFQKSEVDDSLKQLLVYKAMNIQEYAVYTRYLNLYKGHFGLSLDYYTHFTSPLRRFADQIVHEQLEKCINNKQMKNSDIALMEEEIVLVNKARAKNKRLKQFVVECFINLYLYHCRQKIKTKGFIIRLGLHSATIYVPQYNLVKEVPWVGSTSYTDKDKIELVMKSNSERIVKEFQKNDCLDIEIKWEKHQEIQLSLQFEHQGQLIQL